MGERWWKDEKHFKIPEAKRTLMHAYTQYAYWGLHTHTTHPFNGPFSGTTRVGRYQKGKTNLDFTEARDSEWQWHQLHLAPNR